MVNVHRRFNYIGKIRVEGVMHEDKDSVDRGIVGFHERLFKETEQWRPRVDGLRMPFLESRGGGSFG